MPDWGLLPSNKRFISAGGFPGGEAGGTTVTPNATANVKGSWVEFVSSLEIECLGFYVNIQRANTQQIDALFDIGVGGAGSEEPVVLNCPMNSGQAQYPFHYFFPLYIAAGSRVSIRAQASQSNALLEAQMGFFARPFLGFPTYRKATAYGINTSDSGGTNVDPGGTADTKGSYAELTASTSEEVSQFLIAASNQNNFVRSFFDWNVDLAIGAAGSEQIILADYLMGGSGTNDQIWPVVSGLVPLRIHKGSRIAARSACSGTDATDRTFDLSVVGFH